MNKNELTPKESFNIISQIINESKVKFEESGIIFTMWGALIFLTSFAEYFLLKSGYNDIHYYPYFIIPIGVIVSWYYYKNKIKNNKTYIDKLVFAAWTIISINILILGFLFATIIDKHLSGFILILTGIGTLIWGIVLNKKFIISAGAIINISGFVCFMLNNNEQLLLVGSIGLITIFIPGLILILKQKKTNV